MGRADSLSSRLWAIAIWALVIFFIVNLIAMVGTVVVNSLGTRWLGTWLPAGFTTKWYASAWNEFQLDQVLVVTFEVVGAVAEATHALPAVPALAAQLSHFSRSSATLVTSWVGLTNRSAMSSHTSVVTI